MLRRETLQMTDSEMPLKEFLNKLVKESKKKWTIQCKMTGCVLDSKTGRYGLYIKDFKINELQKYISVVWVVTFDRKIVRYSKSLKISECFIQETMLSIKILEICIKENISHFYHVMSNFIYGSKY